MSVWYVCLFFLLSPLSALSWTEDLPARTKLDWVWSQIVSDPTPQSWGTLFELLARGLLLQTDDTERLTERGTLRQFDHPRKMLHTQGAYARVQWRAVENTLGYTGVFAEPKVEGIISVSKGNRLVSNSTNSWGLGLMLFRDNAPPAATVFCSPSTFLHNLFNYNWNLLAMPLCSHVDGITGSVLSLLARKHPQTPGTPVQFWTKYGFGFGTSNFADTSSSGASVADPWFPYSLCLRAPLSLSQQFEGTPPWSHPIEALQHYPSHDVLLFEVLAIDQPLQAADVFNLRDHAQVIGQLWLQSAFTSSGWGDNHISFQHQKLEEDLALRPTWQSQLTPATILLDGWGNTALYSDRLRPPTATEILTSLRPALTNLIHMATDPLLARQFVQDELLGNLDHLWQGDPTDSRLSSRLGQDDMWGGKDDVTDMWGGMWGGMVEWVMSWVPSRQTIARCPFAVEGGGLLSTARETTGEAGKGTGSTRHALHTNVTESHMTGPMTGQLTGQLPGQLTGQLPGQLTGQLPGDMKSPYDGSLSSPYGGLSADQISQVSAVQSHLSEAHLDGHFLSDLHLLQSAVHYSAHTRQVVVTLLSQVAAALHSGDMQRTGQPDRQPTFLEGVVK